MLTSGRVALGWEVEIGGEFSSQTWTQGGRVRVNVLLQKPRRGRAPCHPQGSALNKVAQSRRVCACMYVCVDVGEPFRPCRPQESALNRVAQAKSRWVCVYMYVDVFVCVLWGVVLEYLLVFFPLQQEESCFNLYCQK